MRGFPWRWVLLGVALTLVLLCLTGWAWLCSTGDLDAFAKEAVAAEVSLLPPPMDPVREAWWQDLGVRTSGAPDIVLNYIDLQVIERLDSPPFEDVLARADMIPAGSVSPPDRELARELRSICMARLLIEPSSTVPQVLDRIHRFAAAEVGPDDVWSSWSDTMMWRMVEAVARRRDNLAAEDRPVIAAKLSALADLLEQRVRMHAASLMRNAYALARQGPLELSTGLQPHLTDLYSVIPSGLACMVVERGGRAPYLRDLLAWHQAMTKATDARDMIHIARLDQERWRDPSWQQLLPRQFMGLYWQQGYFHLRAIGGILHLRLLAADLTGNPWPEDPFADPGTPLHRVERDGVLLGAWSVGFDGVPQGGDRNRDVCMSLGPPLGKPNMADPLPPAL